MDLDPSYLKMIMDDTILGFSFLKFAFEQINYEVIRKASFNYSDNLGVQNYIYGVPAFERSIFPEKTNNIDNMSTSYSKYFDWRAPFQTDFVGFMHENFLDTHWEFLTDFVIERGLKNSSWNAFIELSYLSDEKRY